MMQTIPVTGEFEVGVKRFYLPIEIKRNCPSCNTRLTCDLEKNYLFEPSINKKETITFFCDECDDHYHADAVLKVELHVSREIKKE